MKIVFYSTFLLEYGGGLEKYYIETAAYLAEQPGITVEVVTMDDDFMRKMTNAFSVFYMRKIDHSVNYKEKLSDIEQRLGKATYRKVGTFKQLRTALQDCDVVYCKNELIESFILTFLVRYKGLAPIVYGGHTPLRYPIAQSFHAKLHNALYAGASYRFMASKVRAFHAINSYEESLYRQLFPDKEVRKIYNPFDINRFRALANANPHPLEYVQPDHLNILWAGRLTEQKGVRDLPLVIGQLNSDPELSKRIHLTIVGDGDERPVVESLAASHNNVHYLGHTDQKYMADIYRQHDMFVSTSKWEGYPYTLIEMQAFGLAGFAYDIPGPSDIFQEYEGGNIVADWQELAAHIGGFARAHPTRKSIPTYPASTQFEPQKIYKQLLQYLQERASTP